MGKKRLFQNISKASSNLGILVGKRPFPKMERVVQKTSLHCGPAVVKMLFSFLGKRFSQDRIVKAAKIGKRLRKYGMVIKDMGLAVKKLGEGEFGFWYKKNARVSDIAKIVNKYGYPVGVGWQGVFLEDEGEDNGHFSLVVKVDSEKDYLLLTDPYHRFVGKERKFRTKEFEDRWWDYDEITIKTRKKVVEFTKHLIFVITPKDEKFPKKLGMIKG